MMTRALQHNDNNSLYCVLSVDCGQPSRNTATAVAAKTHVVYCVANDNISMTA